MTQILPWALAALVLAGAALAAEPKPQEAPWPFAPVPAGAWHFAAGPDSLAGVLAAKDEIGLPPADVSGKPIAWCKPRSSAGWARWPAAPPEQCLYAVTHLHSPVVYRSQPYRFRLSCEGEPALWVNGQEIPLKPAAGGREGSLESHRMRHGLNRVVVRLAAGRPARFRLDVAQPGDVRFLAEIPRAQDPARHLNAWRELALENGLVRLRVAVPNVERGFYRGNRFEEAGMILHLEAGGHTYFREPEGPHTPLEPDASMGPAEEFFEAIAWKDARPGEPFIKIGVGLFEKPVQDDHAWYCPYWPLKRFPWKTRQQGPNAVEFEQDVAGPRGWGYRYVKRLVLPAGRQVLRVEHEFTNTGQHPIAAEQYSHNWVRLDRVPIGKGYRVEFPFAARAQKDVSRQALFEGNRVALLTGEPTHMLLSGWPAGAGGTTAVLSCEGSPARIRIGGDFPLSSLALYWDPRGVCLEPFVRFELAPGRTERWVREYEFQNGSDA